MFSLCLSTLAYSAPLASRPALVGRSVEPMMQTGLGQLSKKVVSFDQDGVFEGREVGVAKPPVRLLERIEELRVLSQVSESGLLSSAEDAGLFSKLEAAGAFSKAEALLNVPSSSLFGIASLLLVGEAGLIAF